MSKEMKREEGIRGFHNRYRTFPSAKVGKTTVEYVPADFWAEIKKSASRPEVIRAWIDFAGRFREKMSLPDDKDLKAIEKFIGMSEIWGRLVACSAVRNDPIDDFGMFGSGPGFIFILGLRDQPKPPVRSSEVAVALGLTLVPAWGENGQELHYISHHDAFPSSLSYDVITRSTRPNLLAAITNSLGGKIYFRPPGIILGDASCVVISDNQKPL
jgi:hypothetical protein